MKKRKRSLDSRTLNYQPTDLIWCNEWVTYHVTQIPSLTCGKSFQFQTRMQFTAKDDASLFIWTEQKWSTVQPRKVRIYKYGSAPLVSQFICMQLRAINRLCGSQLCKLPVYWGKNDTHADLQTSRHKKTLTNTRIGQTNTHRRI